jgi:membrane-associated phospholipid phosphatase
MNVFNNKNIIQYFINEFWTSITLLGTPIFYIIIILLISHFNLNFNPIKTLIEFLLLEILCFFLKIFISKSRPEKSIKRVFVNLYQERSFPSIHSARVSLLCYIFFNTLPELNFIFATIVILVGYSRIYIREHDYIDVLGGVSLGLLFGLCWTIFYV